MSKSAKTYNQVEAIRERLMRAEGRAEKELGHSLSPVFCVRGLKCRYDTTTPCEPARTMVAHWDDVRTLLTALDAATDRLELRDKQIRDLLAKAEAARKEEADWWD